MKPNFSIGVQLTILILSVFFCLTLASLFTGLTLSFLGIESIDMSTPKTYLLAGFYSQLLGFIGGFFLFLRLTKTPITSILQIAKPDVKLILIVLVILAAAYPIMLILGDLNSFLKDLIPNNTFILEEEETDKYQLALLTTTGYVMLSLKLFVVAILPAIGEELVFRGVLLEKIKQASKNEHYAVIVSALIFAGIHLQPTKLLPMFFLGLVLGYLYTKSKNIVYPILFHFLFNATTITLAHFNHMV